jgi:glutaconate CoA-transferase, subunit A
MKHHEATMSKLSSAAPQLISLEALAASIPNGASIAIPPDYSGVAMAATRALLSRKNPVRDLHLIAVPQAGIQADMLIGAGAVGRVEAAAITLGEQGLAPRFSAALKSGEIDMMDATCPAIQAALQASEKGIPFIPLRGIIGSDLLRVRPDWKVISNPLAEPGPLNEQGLRDPIVILPAIKPDIALFHAAKADRNGNVWIGIRRELMLMAHASRKTYVTVEEIVDTDFLSDPAIAAGTISSLYISTLTLAPLGAEPVGLAGCYPQDRAALAAYAAAARTADGFRAWLAATLDQRVLA